MRRARRLLLAFLAFVACLVAQAVRAEDAPDSIPTSDQLVEADSSAVLGVHRAFWKAYQDRDLWGMRQIWDNANGNITAAFPAASFTAAGWANVEENFRRTFVHNRDIKIDERVIRLHRQGNVAWILGSVRFEAVQTQTGQFVAMDRMLTTELYRLRDGVWKLELYHGDYPGFSPPKEHSPIFQLQAIAAPLRSPSDAWDTYDRFIAAFERREISGVFDLLTADADASAIQPISAVPFLGPQNVIASWKKAFDEIQSITIQPQRLVIDQDGDIAWISEAGQYHVMFRANPGDVVHMHNVMVTYILRRRRAEWQLVHYHAHQGFPYEDQEH
jgi:ketosteroid isomerase-like protein